MAVLRQIRHGVLALIAGFLIVVMLGPTETPATLWNVANPSDDSKPFALVTPSSTLDPLASKARVSDAQAGKIRWRIEMTKHYARQEARRIGLSPHQLPTLNNVAEQTKVDSQINLESQTNVDSGSSDDVDAAAAINGPAAIDGSVTQLASYRNPSTSVDALEDATGDKANTDSLDQAAYRYWLTQNAAAEQIGQRMQQLNEQSLHAKAIGQLPGQPTTATLIWATLVGLLFVSIVVPFGWAASQKIESPEQTQPNVLEVPRDWFRCTPTNAQMIAKVMRSVSLVVILASLVLLTMRAYQDNSNTGPERTYSYTERLIARPLAEVADLI